MNSGSKLFKLTLIAIAACDIAELVFFLDIPLIHHLILPWLAFLETVRCSSLGFTGAPRNAAVLTRAFIYVLQPHYVEMQGADWETDQQSQAVFLGITFIKVVSTSRWICDLKTVVTTCLFSRPSEMPWLGWYLVHSTRDKLVTDASLLTVIRYLKTGCSSNGS